MDLTTRKTIRNEPLGADGKRIDTGNRINNGIVSCTIKARPNKSIFSIRSIMDVDDDYPTDTSNNNHAGECWFFLVNKIYLE